MTKDGSWFIAMNKVAGTVSLLILKVGEEGNRRLLSGNFLLVVSV
jgi:hypothetical protein